MEKFDKKVANKILPKFNNAREWSDLMTILKKLKENFQKYEHLNMALLSEKVTLTKRLAQCLNVNLPGGLHEMALDVYGMLFENIKKHNENLIGEDLGLYSSGLFPFFTYASAHNKMIFLANIIKKHYLTLNKEEFILALPGMLVSILPGIEEQNEAMQKEIKDIFSEARKIVDDEYFYGTIWSIILRTQRLRLVCIKYLSETVPPYKVIEDDPDQRDEIIRNYYPNLPILVLNSMKVLIEESDVQSQRLSMDFIISHFPVYNNLLDEDNKIQLLTSGLKLLIKNDYSTTRRLLMWLLGPTQEEEIEMGDPNIKYMEELLTKALKEIFSKSERNLTQSHISNSIKLIDQLFKQQVKLGEYILAYVSFDMINLVEAFWAMNGYTAADESVKKIQNFFNYDPNYLDSLWNSLGKKLNATVNQIQIEEDVFLEEIESRIKILRFCLLNIRLYTIDKKIKYYIPIISSLLKGFQKFRIESSENLMQIRPLIIVALKFTQSLQAGSEEPIAKSLFSFTQTQMNATGTDTKAVFSPPIKFSSQKCNSKQFILKYSEQNYGLIEMLMENIILFHSVYITICQVIYSNGEELTRHDIATFTQATELSLLIEEYVTSDQVPEWVFHLEKVIFCENIDVSLEGIFYLIDLFTISSENPIYDNIKSFLRNEEVSTDIIHESLLDDLVHQTHVRKNCIELAMSRLWILVEDQNHQKPVIDLLIKFYTADQNVFQNTISNTFAVNDLDQNVNAIKKFNQFWKLTSEFYPEMIFFENGECIFKMLDFLDHEHPLLRHLSKSWLSEAKDQFRKIIDPLLKVLLDKDTSWYISFQKQLYFTKEYDNRRIIEAFRKLKNIIINVPDIAIHYFVTQQITQSLRDMDTIGKELRSVSKAITISHYLDLFVSISLRFIQGKFIESISVSFYRENFSVNAASCEFLEFLLSFIEPKSQVMNIAKVISEPVLSILQETLMTNDEVMQVQLLNLLRVLLINTKDEHLNYEDDAKQIFSSKKFHDCIISGIQINYIFVRGYFINFVESCLPIFSNILDQEPNLEIAKKLINTTTDFMVSRVKYNFKSKKGAQNKLSSMELSETNAKFCVIKNYLEDYREFKLLDENDLLVITKGLKNILFHFLNITSPVYSPTQANWLEVKKEMVSKSVSPYSFFGFMYGKSSSNSQLDKNNQNKIGSEIIEILQDVFASFCTCWINGSEAYISKDYCLNDNGLLSTSNEDRTFQNNKHGALGETNIQLKSQIVSILLNIFIKNPFDFIKNLIGLFQTETNRYICNDKQYKLSLIEMLISLEIPTELFLFAVNKIIDVSKIKEIKRSKVRLKDMYPFYLNKEQCSYEAKLCQLVYAFINYNTQLRVDKSLVDIWNEMITFVNIMKDSKSSCTLFWLYELVNLLLYRLPIRESCTDVTIKKNLSLLVIDLFNKILDISITNKYDSLYEESTQLITPLPPSIYESVAYEVYGERISKNSLNIKGSISSKAKAFSNNPSESFAYSPLKKKDSSIIKDSPTIIDSNNDIKDTKIVKEILPDEESTNQFFVLIHDYIENKSVIKNEDLIVAYRNIGFITLKSLFYSTMKNIFSPEKMAPFFQLLIKNLISIMNEKVSFNKIYVDMSTEFLHSLIINASTITHGSCKQLIMDFFLEPEFFNMTLHCLRLWKDIICEFSRSYQDIINDLMDKMNQGGFFAKNTDKFNIKAMRRISFIIYSSPKDTYSNKLALILEKVKEMITKYSENPALESEIFLMIRIMFLRFSHENLIEMIRALWPIIFSEIVNVIKSKRKTSSIDLNLSGFKLIELLSVANMDEFALYQWIFFVDSFKSNDINPSNDQGIFMNMVKSNVKAYKPFAFDMAKNWDANSDLIEKYSKGEWEDFNRRKLMITVQKIASQDELGILISRVFIYIALMNNFRNVIDYDTVEEVIEKDFLHD